MRQDKKWYSRYAGINSMEEHHSRDEQVRTTTTGGKILMVKSSREC
jgi:hypothetical protein